MQYLIPLIVRHWYQRITWGPMQSSAPISTQQSVSRRFAKQALQRTNDIFHKCSNLYHGWAAIMFYISWHQDAGPICRDDIGKCFGSTNHKYVLGIPIIFHELLKTVVWSSKLSIGGLHDAHGWKTCRKTRKVCLSTDSSLGGPEHLEGLPIGSSSKFSGTQKSPISRPLRAIIYDIEGLIPVQNSVQALGYLFIYKPRPPNGSSQ